MNTAAVFALFYAILFGGTLNRLLAWSAFWKGMPWESWGKWRSRLFWSWVWFVFIPGGYLGFVFHLVRGRQSPEEWWRLVIWAMLIFMSVIFINACYRFWVAIVVDRRIYPEYAAGEKRQTMEWLVSFGACNYLVGGLVAFGFSALGLLLLVMFFR